MQGNKATVWVDGEELNGLVEAVHGSGEKIDVRIDHPGSKKHGRVLTVAADDVDVIEPANTKSVTDLPADNSKFVMAVHDRFTELEDFVKAHADIVSALADRVTALEKKFAEMEAAAKSDPPAGMSA